MNIGLITYILILLSTYTILSHLFFIRSNLINIGGYNTTMRLRRVKANELEIASNYSMRIMVQLLYVA